MIAIAELYAVGKNKEKSKSGKNCYTFLNGNVSDEPGELVDKCSSVSWWTDRDIDVHFMEQVRARVEIQGEYVSIIDLL